MYRALYDFKAEQRNCLSFKSGDRFTVLGDSTGDWLRVQNGYGQIGLVPYNYVAQVITQDNGVIDEVLQSIDRAIEGIHYAASRSGDVYTKEQRENLKALIEHRQKVASGQNAAREELTTSNTAYEPSPQDVPPQPNRVAPVLPSPLGSDLPVNTNAENRRSWPKREAPPPPPRTSSQLLATTPVGTDAPVLQPDTFSTADSKSDFPSPPDEESMDFPQPPEFSPDTSTTEEAMVIHSSPPPTASESSFVEVTNEDVPADTASWDNNVPPILGYELVEEVRRNTGLSYNRTLVAVETVVKLIGSRVPCTQKIMEKVSQVLYEVQDDDVELDSCHDSERLRLIFSELSECKNDSQQRSWALYEDESVILQHLNEMISILENANPKLCRRCIAVDSYEPLHTLVQYYQMETRASIRLVLLKGFTVLCYLDSNAITELLYSVLPLELCTDLQSNIIDTQRTCSSAMVLTMVLSKGEDVPIHHYVHLNTEFVSFLLDKIEMLPDEDVANSFVNLILAFNLHFRDLQLNSVMGVLGERGTATVFTEKLMLLVNRGEDPVQILPHKPKARNALSKFLTDMYSSPSTSDLLYTNDAMVLIDIIIRQLSDLPAGDQERTENLILIGLILTNSPYREEKYRLDDLRCCLSNIYKEEEGAEKDKLQVQKIFQQFSYLFPSCC